MHGSIARCSVPASLVAGAILLITPVPSPADPGQVYFSLNSMYGMAADRKHIRDFGAAYELPVGRGMSAVARGRYLRVKQDLYDEDERRDNVYANMFPTGYRLLGFQSALRIRPWDWMEGFYSEALLGYKNISGADPEASPGWSLHGQTVGPGIAAFVNHAFEAAVGFGYIWEAKRMRVALGFAFGPEFLLRGSTMADGTRESSGEILDLLRFNQFEVGYAF